MPALVPTGEARGQRTMVEPRCVLDCCTVSLSLPERIPELEGKTLLLLVKHGGTDKSPVAFLSPMAQCTLEPRDFLSERQDPK